MGDDFAEREPRAQNAPKRPTTRPAVAEPQPMLHPVVGKPIDLLALQRTAGNRVTRHLIDSATAGPKAGRWEGVATLRRSLGSPVIQRQMDLQPGDSVIVKYDDAETKEQEQADAVIAEVLEGGKKYRVKFNVPELHGFVSDVHDEGLVSKRATARKGKETVEVRGFSGPPWNNPNLGLPADVAQKVAEAGGEAKVVKDLTEDQLETLIDLFRDYLSKDAEALGGAKGMMHALQEDLRSLELFRETPEEVTAREDKVNLRIKELEDTAFSGQFGSLPDQTNLADIERELDDWFLRVKKDEKAIQFAAAYKANRMTARQINLADGKGRKAVSFKARKYRAKADPTDRNMVLDPSPAGIEKRLDPANFMDQKAVNEAGVHDLSASMLRGDENQEIYGQLKPYAEAVVVFMPLPAERDLQIFSALARVGGMTDEVKDTVGRMLTRPVYAQPSDMHTTYQDMTPGSDGQGNFVYGNAGLVLRVRGNEKRDVAMNKADLAERRKAALLYTEVAKASLTKVNEIVLAYRAHESTLFPMFGAWDADHKEFVVLDSQLEPTGNYISNHGEYE